MKTLVLGSAVLDMIMNVPSLPKTMEDVHPTAVAMQLGGMAYNVYEIMMRFQCDALLGVPAGTGFFADAVINIMNEKGVQPWVRVRDKDNGVCLCFVEGNGERTFVSHHGAEYMFDPKWFESLNFDEIDRIYVSGLEVEEPTGDKLIEFLEKRKKMILFAPGPRLLKIPNEKMQRMLDMNVTLHLNEMEAMQLSQKNSISSAAEALCDRTGAAVIVTCGARGAYLKEPGKEGKLIGSRKAVVVDTIGAGDAHAGAVLAMLQQGKTMEEAVRMANIVASFVVESQGAGLSAAEFERIRETL